MKILFIHIAKAAGSSVNRFFMDRLGPERCAVHIESSPAWRQDAAGLADRVDFLSGHIVYREFRDKLDLDNCFVFTFLRDPREQVISHLAWIRRLAEPSQADRLAEHPPYVRKLAQKLAGLDFGAFEQVAGFVANLEPDERALLDNPQVRYLRAGRNWGWVNDCDVHSALARLCRLNAFGFVENLAEGLGEVAFTLGLEAPDALPRENAQDGKYGMSAGDDRLMAALHDLIRHDLALYRAALALHAEQTNGHVFPALCRDYDDLSGHLDRVNGQVISGWARLEGSAEPVTLDVMVNDECRATVVADRPRPDLAEKFGRDCAFVCRLDPDSAPVSGDLVAVVLAGTKVELNGSPMRCP